MSGSIREVQDREGLEAYLVKREVYLGKECGEGLYIYYFLLTIYYWD